MAITYTVNKDTWECLVFDTDKTTPMISQPYYPDGTPFGSEKEATDWVKNFVDELVKERTASTTVVSDSGE